MSNMECSRCSGRGIYFIRVVNGKGVPATPANGVCYACHGKGTISTNYKEDNKVKINANNLLLFVAQHIINAGGQESQDYLKECIAKKFNITYDQATYAYQQIKNHEYVDYNVESDVTWVYLNKKICDAIRKINASKKIKA